ncbi:MAG: hypothetical protein WBA25_06710 [Jannaschia sp.]
MNDPATDRGEAAEDASEASEALPYDAVAWERRLEVAREKRAKVLRRPAAGVAEGGGDRTPASSLPAALHHSADPTFEPGQSAPPRDRIAGFDWWKLTALASTGVALLAVGVAVGLVLADRHGSIRTLTDVEPDTVAAEMQTASDPVATVAPPRTADSRLLSQTEAVAAERRIEDDAAISPIEVRPSDDFARMFDDLPSQPPIPRGDGVGAAYPAVELVLHTPPSVAETARNALTHTLSEESWIVGDPVPVRFTIGETHLRYYHLADAPAAEEVSEALELPIRDFTDYRPSPRKGVVEIWMAGRSPRVSQTPRRSVTRSQGPSLAELLARIREENDED